AVPAKNINSVTASWLEKRLNRQDARSAKKGKKGKKGKNKSDDRKGAEERKGKQKSEVLCAPAVRFSHLCDPTFLNSWPSI
ncbi:MAG TPA: hypothetical protein VFW88_09795, partial [Burkholderiales bacterium]|nr:hypothetical protein [Burkholderiales bacterium]